MIKSENYLGVLEISEKYLKTLIAKTVTSCFGVTSMNLCGTKQGVKTLLPSYNKLDTGILIKHKDSKVIVDLHITVSYGVNISAIVESIIHKVKYTVEDQTDLSVHKVNVFIDGMIG